MLILDPPLAVDDAEKLNSIRKATKSADQMLKAKTDAIRAMETMSNPHMKL
jgi:hypothetical protein